jgi:hypothetical protein
MTTATTRDFVNSKAHMTRTIQLDRTGVPPRAAPRHRDATLRPDTPHAVLITYALNSAQRGPAPTNDPTGPCPLTYAA